LASKEFWTTVQVSRPQRFMTRRAVAGLASSARPLPPSPVKRAKQWLALRTSKAHREVCGWFTRGVSIEVGLPRPVIRFVAANDYHQTVWRIQRTCSRVDYSKPLRCNSEPDSALVLRYAPCCGFPPRRRSLPLIPLLDGWVFTTPR